MTYLKTIDGTTHKVLESSVGIIIKIKSHPLAVTLTALKDEYKIDSDGTVKGIQEVQVSTTFITSNIVYYY